MTSIRNRLVLFTFLCFPFTLPLAAQTFGNEWINYSLPYFKIPVYREGIYRIDSALLATRYNLSQVNPQNFKVFLNGKEQFLYAHGESDQQWDTGDYLEFYGNPDYTWPDSTLYHQISYLPNPHRSMFGDTTYAFLTLASSASSKHYTLETDTAVSNYPAAQYVYAEKRRGFNDTYNDVREYGNYPYSVSDPRYTQAEGYGSGLNKGNNAYSAFVPTQFFTVQPLPVYVTIQYAGGSAQYDVPLDHEVQVLYNDVNNNTVVLQDTLFEGFIPVRGQFTLTSNQVSSGTEFSVVSVANPSFSAFSNLTVLHFFHMLYPRSLNMGFVNAERMHADNSGTSAKTGFSFFNFGLVSNSAPLLYDITEGRKIPAWVTGAFTKAVVPNGTARHTLYLTSDSAVIKVKKLIPAGVNGLFTNYLQGSPTNAYVIVFNQKLQASVSSYTAYRTSAAGGQWQMIAADVDELYDQYAQGQRRHPAGVRNFLRCLNSKLPSPPANVMLIGSATTPGIYDAQHPLNLVPTMGRPNSDNLLADGLKTPGTYNFYPDLAIGRIAAVADDEVNAYLDKVKEHDALGQVEWKKKVLHFVGGNTPELASRLDGYMTGFRLKIEDTLFGASVHTFRKNSSDAIQVVLSDSIKDMINQGTSLLTFFGHGSPYGFDQAVDEPQLYSNKGKYPFMYANSCYSGDIHDPVTVTVSKRFVLAPQRGSIGFLATTSLGDEKALRDYGDQFYTALSSTKYDRNIGEIIREAAYRTSQGNNLIARFTAMDMTLHGDPAVKVSNGMMPDYVISNNDLRFNLRAKRDTVILDIAMHNIGRAVRDSFLVFVERFMKDGDTVASFRRVSAPFNIDSVRFILPVLGPKGSGLNRFRVTLDRLGEISETNETNNSTGLIDVFIQGNDIVPVYPYPFAVVPATGSVTLKACTIDPFAAEATYRFQLDTSAKFLNPVASQVITSKGGVIAWDVSLPYPDSTSFFWRVARDSAGVATDWKQSSFTVINQKRGWAQKHFDQYLDNGYRFVTPKPDIRRFVFENRLNTINSRTSIFPSLPLPLFTYYFNNNQMDSWSCTFDGWNFAVFDSISGEPVSVINPAWPGNGTGSFGDCMCGRPNKNQFIYYFGRFSECSYPADDVNWKTKMESFLNAIPQNNYVLGYTTGFRSNYSETSTYSNSLYSAFESIGSGSIRTVPDTLAMVIFGRKGMSPGQAKERIGQNKTDILYTQDTIRTNWNSGYIASDLIGPSNKWNSLHWRVASLDALPGDSTVVKVVGLHNNGSLDTLLTLTTASLNVLQLDNLIDAKLYAYIKLVAYMWDNQNGTSPQLKYWMVLHEEAPDCALNPLRTNVVLPDTLQEGQRMGLVMPIENVGPTPFNDSLVVTYWVNDHSGVMRTLPDHVKPAPFVPGQVFFDSLDISSMQLQGNNELWLAANPPLNVRYQRERNYFNNIARIPFHVSGDVTNPLLDVTFDGRHILNNDIVSAKPEIRVSLKDENQFLALNDTSDFSITLTKPGSSNARPVYFGPEMQFSPASLPKNSASILYTPTLSVDGKYVLNVQASDRSKNASGANAYQIAFEVNNKPSVTQIMNYPNPFTTSTRFVFTLTGSEVPEVFTIQIMTVTGKVVREITRSELGMLRIGRNITDYAWDGRDTYGDRLANGIYLYKVNIRLNGNTLEKRASGADKYFTHEIGKMVLLR